MDIKLIHNDIAELLKMAEGWSTDGEVSDIERDIALDKIKRLYEQLRFSPLITPPSTAPTAEESSELEVEVELTYYEGEEEDNEVDNELVKSEDKIEDVNEDIEEEEDDDEPLIPFELIDISIIPEVEEEEEVEELVEKLPQQETIKEEPRQEPVAPIENALFDITTIPIRQKSRRSAILSLYSDNETPSTPTPQPQSRPSTTEAIKELEIVEIKTEEPTAEPTYITTIADRYAEQMSSDTIASSSAPSSSINDRYIISQELFSGDMQACEEMLNTLEGIDNFDDGMIYIIENYDWNPDCEAAKLVIKLLEQRFLS